MNTKKTLIDELEVKMQDAKTNQEYIDLQEQYDPLQKEYEAQKEQMTDLEYSIVESEFMMETLKEVEVAAGNARSEGQAVNGEHCLDTGCVASD